MALGDTYSQLKADVASWLNRDDLSANVPDMITLGENRAYRELRLRCMEAALSSTISSGTISVPERYVAMKYAYVNATPVSKLERKDAEWIYQTYPTRSADGIPRYFAREADSFIFAPYPDSAYTVKGIYYRRLPALSDSNTTNWFTENAPELLLFAALAEAKAFIEDNERVSLWNQKYMDVRDRLMKQEEDEEFSGSPLAMTNR